MHPVYAFKIGFCFSAISIFIHRTRYPAGLMRINIMFHDIHEYCNDYTLYSLTKQFFSHNIYLYSTFAPYFSPMNEGKENSFTVHGFSEQTVPRVANSIHSLEITTDLSIFNGEKNSTNI